MNANDLPQAVERIDAHEREALALKDALEQIDIASSRNPEGTQELAAVYDIAMAAKAFINTVVGRIPAGKEREVALNNTLSAVLWAKHGLVSHRVTLGVGEPPPLEGIPPFQPSLALSGFPTFVQQGTDTVPEFTPVAGANAGANPT